MITKKELMSLIETNQFRTREVPLALRCEYCTGALFQAFEEDVFVVVDKKCLTCFGRGLAPIPPAEVGL